MLMMRSDIRFLSDGEILASYNAYKKEKKFSTSKETKSAVRPVKKKVAIDA